MYLSVVFLVLVISLSLLMTRDNLPTGATSASEVGIGFIIITEAPPTPPRAGGGGGGGGGLGIFIEHIAGPLCARSQVTFEVTDARFNPLVLEIKPYEGNRINPQYLLPGYFKTDKDGLITIVFPRSGHYIIRALKVGFASKKIDIDIRDCYPEPDLPPFEPRKPPQGGQPSFGLPEGAQVVSPQAIQQSIRSNWLQVVFLLLALIALGLSMYYYNKYLAQPEKKRRPHRTIIVGKKTTKKKRSHVKAKKRKK